MDYREVANLVAANGEPHEDGYGYSDVVNGLGYDVRITHTTHGTRSVLLDATGVQLWESASTEGDSAVKVEISEMDEHGGVWVTVTGSESNGDKLKSASAKAAGAIRKYAADHGFGKALRITSGGTSSFENWEYSVRYHFERQTVTELTDTASVTDEAVGVDEDSPALAAFAASDWASDELHDITVSADSRCQAQPVHRMRGAKSVGVVELPNGMRVAACAQCVEYYTPKLGRLH